MTQLAKYSIFFLTLFVISCEKKQSNELSNSSVSFNDLKTATDTVSVTPKHSSQSGDSIRAGTPSMFFELVDSLDEEVKAALELVTPENAVSDGVMKIKDGHFLFYTFNAGRILQGIYAVNTNTKVVEKVQGGAIDSLYIIYREDTIQCLILQSTSMSQGNSCKTISGVVFKDTDTSNCVFEYLSEVCEDGDAGGCGDSQLKEAGSIDSTIIKKPSKNGDLSITIFTTITNCENVNQKKVKTTFSFENNSFIKYNHL